MNEGERFKSNALHPPTIRPRDPYPSARSCCLGSWMSVRSPWCRRRTMVALSSALQCRTGSADCRRLDAAFRQMGRCAQAVPGLLARRRAPCPCWTSTRRATLNHTPGIQTIRDQRWPASSFPDPGQLYSPAPPRAARSQILRLCLGRALPPRCRAVARPTGHNPPRPAGETRSCAPSFRDTFMCL